MLFFSLQANVSVNAATHEMVSSSCRLVTGVHTRAVCDHAEHSLGRSEAPDSSEGLKGPDSGDRIAQALKASFQDLDAQILAEEQKQGVEKGAFGGCTAVVALVMGDVSLSPFPSEILTSQQSFLCFQSGTPHKTRSTTPKYGGLTCQPVAAPDEYFLFTVSSVLLYQTFRGKKKRTNAQTAEL